MVLAFSAMAADPALAEAVARDRALREQLQARFACYAEVPAPDRFRALLDTTVAPIADTRHRSPWRASTRRWAQGAAIAATLVLGVVLVVLLVLWLLGVFTHV